MYCMYAMKLKKKGAKKYLKVFPLNQPSHWVGLQLLAGSRKYGRI